MEDLNLHFTGDIHAITSANNLLAAMLDAHLMHGNGLGIDPLTITWRRCLDMNDRALRDMVISLGGKTNGYPRQTGFDITAASETMAIVAVSRDLADLRRRLGAITVGATTRVHRHGRRPAGCRIDGGDPERRAEAEPRADARGPAGVRPLRAVRERRARQQLAGRRPDRAQAGELVVTEGGFASDMGLEKFLDIVCRLGRARAERRRPRRDRAGARAITGRRPRARARPTSRATSASRTSSACSPSSPSTASRPTPTRTSRRCGGSRSSSARTAPPSATGTSAAARVR